MTRAPRVPTDRKPKGKVDPFPEAYTGLNAGWSTCPCCGRSWLVTPQDDCLMPACGCFGDDPTTGMRPCEKCGLGHALVAPRSCQELARLREADGVARG